MQKRCEEFIKRIGEETFYCKQIRIQGENLKVRADTDIRAKAEGRPMRLKKLRRVVDASALVPRQCATTCSQVIRRYPEAFKVIVNTFEGETFVLSAKVSPPRCPSHLETFFQDQRGPRPERLFVEASCWLYIDILYIDVAWHFPVTPVLYVIVIRAVAITRFTRPLSCVRVMELAWAAWNHRRCRVRPHPPT